MSVIDFPQPQTPRAWRADELAQLVRLVPVRGASWDTGTTERGDPQFYVLGPAPDHDCLLCVSRLAQGYVLQDGAGRIVGEAPSLDRFAAETARSAMRGGRSFVARVLIGWCALRLTLEEKMEPVLEQGEELLARFAPQLAALA